MAFQQSAAPRPIAINNTPRSQDASSQTQIRPALEDSQEWVLFTPSTADSTITRTHTTHTVGASRVSDVSLNTAARSSSILDDDVTEDGDLDSLDDGLHAFREPPLYPTISQQTQAPLLPAHDGLGTFPASSPPVLEQLWQHEQYNPKRKHDGQHRRPSSIQRRLDTIDELEAQANEEKRMRIEKWRMEQSQALMEEVERETRRRLRRGSRLSSFQETMLSVNDDILGSTPKQSDYLPQPMPDADESEPFWRRITKKFIRDIIGIDEPLLSVICGESLPEDAETRPSSSAGPLPTIPEQSFHAQAVDNAWRDRLLQRIARELGVFVHQLSPHPGAFNTYSSSPDYAGMPVSMPPPKPTNTLHVPVNQAQLKDTITSTLSPNFPPTLRDPGHAESWGFEEEPVPPSSPLGSSRNLQKEREYWERELDLKMVFRYLRDRFVTRAPSAQSPHTTRQIVEDAATRAAIIRQHHPLVARAHQSPVRTRRESRTGIRRPQSSCASESVRSSRKASIARSGSSRNFWDIGGSIGSATSMIASGGAWGEV
ncbi:uncharacterized protein A1O9_04482 [Exophiala aquamarina CBS 119918]|uniref:Uncharacterized protein n=1 Tax=Exophiala aquamarina CBS 119918 TaxID=1182545 RepID=A0A072PIC7_9EURO|nr:uncharacterized protein A1O9_04482 [Exophiala aquamarina CBS 119918]KEF59636.1 hypothetical protein A1O9_04482 [Exophiala aquamarina CBS 119918]